MGVVLLSEEGGDFPTKGKVGPVAKEALLLQEGKDPRLGALDQLQAGSVRGKVVRVPSYALGGVHLALPVENDLVEQELELFVRVIDEQLLKPVFQQAFEPVNVQDADGYRRRAQLSVLRHERRVDAFYEPIEQGAVDHFCERVPGVLRLVAGERFGDGGPVGREKCPRRQRPKQPVGVDAKHLAGVHERRVFGEDGHAALVVFELYVP